MFDANVSKETEQMCGANTTETIQRPITAVSVWRTHDATLPSGAMFLFSSRLSTPQLFRGAVFFLFVFCNECASHLEPRRLNETLTEVDRRTAAVL